MNIAWKDAGIVARLPEEFLLRSLVWAPSFPPGAAILVHCRSTDECVDPVAIGNGFG